MVTVFETITGLEDYLRKLRSDERDTLAHLTHVQDKITAIVAALQTMSDDVGINTTSGIEPSDLAGCKTIYEGMKRYAQLNNGLLPMSQAAQAIAAAGITSSPKNARSMLYATKNRHEHEWERVTKGVYAYRPKEVADYTEDE